MLQIMLKDDRLYFGANGFAVSFQRTLRIPDDGKTYPLPPDLGVFPVRRVAYLILGTRLGNSGDCIR